MLAVVVVVGFPTLICCHVCIFQIIHGAKLLFLAAIWHCGLFNAVQLFVLFLHTGPLNK